MSRVGECAEIRRELGVYVLGVISPAGRAVVDRHLGSCPACREEAAGLAGLPAVLRKLPAAVVTRISEEEASRRGAGTHAPAAPLGVLISRAAGRRRQRRWLLGAATALIAGISVAVGLLLLLPPRTAAQPPTSAPQVWAATAHGLNPVTGAGVTVRFRPRVWGTELEATVSGIPAGTTCQIWVTTAGGQHFAAGGWSIARRGPPAWHPASVPFPVASLRGFDVTAHGKVLVSIVVRGTRQGTRNAE